MRGLQLALIVTAAVHGGGVYAGTVHSPLVGTWQLVRFEDTDLKGNLKTPFGEHPKGYFVYDDTGHLSVQIMRTPPLADTQTPKDDFYRKAFESYVAYFGTWRINADGTVVTHVVEGSLNPGYTDTEQPRPFKLNGDTLIIEATGQDGYHYRELHRIR